MHLDPHQPAVSVGQSGASPPDLLRAVLDGVIAFAGILTPEGILTEVNEPALRVTGVGRDAVIGKFFWDCYWWNFDAGVQNRLRDSVIRAASGEQIRYETEIRVAGDARIILDFQISPHRDASGTVDFLIPSAVDITDRVRHDADLRAAHDSFQYLVTHSPFGIYAVDADFRLSMVSAGAQKVFQNVRPLLGRDFAEVLRVIWPEPFVSEAIGHFRQTLATGVSYHAPTVVERREDTTQVESYDWKIERVMLPDGRLGAVCHFYDLSAQEEHAAALRAGEARFRATFDNAAVGIAHVAPDGRWLLVNRKLCTIIGFSEAELLGLSFQDLTYGVDLEKDLELMRQMLVGKIEEYDLEKRYLTKAGTLVWVNLTVSCIRMPDGAVDYCIAVVEDISEKKAAERQQKLLIGELNHRVKNILATIHAMASHTMRNARNMSTFREKFSGRLRAIAASHDSLFQQGKMRAELADLIRKQLAPFAAADRDRLHLSGPPVHLDAACAHALGLITHEMATNASKYGALANTDGRISVSWEPFTQSGKRMARMIWQETGGPPVTPPGKSGFGSRLIRSTLEHSLRGSSRTEFLAGGLLAEFTFEVEDAADD